MKRYVLDSNIVSYYLKGFKKTMDKVDYESTSNDIIIPPMVYFEVRRDLMYLTATKKIRSFENLLNIHGLDVIDKTNFDVATDIYIQLRKNGITIDDADILIAAYCIQNDYILVTNNTKHFENIDGLIIENWLE